MTKRYDAIIVGAGPAGLFAAMELADKGKKVIVIEKGRSIENRKCPMKLGSPECVQCRPCNVVCGWGGAGAFSDGKLTLTPEFDISAPRREQDPLRAKRRPGKEGDHARPAGRT